MYGPYQWSLVGANGKAVKPLSPLPPSRPPLKKIVGVKSSASKLTASGTAATRAAHFFIGKLDKDTTTDEIKEFLIDIGAEVIEVRKLKATEEWQKRSSAFRVMVEHKCKDMILCPDLWPEHVEIREWFFKPK
jgi:hypothetical protein